MAYPAYIREKARWMRVERRLTIDQIAERLAVSRTTVYYWIRDLPAPVEVTHSGRRQAARRKATRAMQRTYRLRQEAAYREGLATFETLSADVTFRDFVCLYLAEGYKRNRNRVAIGNFGPGGRPLGDTLDTSLDHEADSILDPVPRRPGPHRAVPLLERGPRSRGRCDSTAA